jgi:hypothetical protein
LEVIVTSVAVRVVCVPGLALALGAALLPPEVCTWTVWPAARSELDPAVWL